MAPDKESYQYDSLESALVDEGYEIGLLPDFRLISEAEDSKEQRTNRKSFLTRVALASSCLINIFLLWRTCFAPFEAIPSNISRSPYAGLLNDRPTPFRWNTEWSNLDDAHLDELWLSDNNEVLEYGMIALTKTEANAMSLLPSHQHFPWDSKNKALYILNGHHGLHCVRLLYEVISFYRSSTPQKIPHAHVVHCLDSLRQDILCTADDSPRYLHSNGSHSGEDQVRKCRDFDKLNAWAEQHDACYKPIEQLGQDMAEIERYKYCKTDLEALDKARTFFGLSADWQPRPYKKQSSYMTLKDLKDLAHLEERSS